LRSLLLLLLIFFFLQTREILAPELQIDLRRQFLPRQPKTAEAQTRAKVRPKRLALPAESTNLR
jgi:hypothetical protein